MNPATIPLPVLIDALAALRAIKEAPGVTVPNHLWAPAMRAHNQLEAAIVSAGFTFTVSLGEKPLKAA